MSITWPVPPKKSMERVEIEKSNSVYSYLPDIDNNARDALALLYQNASNEKYRRTLVNATSYYLYSYSS